MLSELMPYLQLAGIAILTILITVAIYQIERKSEKFSSISYRKKQIFIGIIFGMLSILGTEYGIDYIGVTPNIRDAAPICAGLVFGAPAGILAGVIGGVERWLAVYWGAGMYTRLACSLATIVAGLFAAFIRTYMMENKRPAWVYALATGFVVEVFHMLLIYLTNMDYPTTASLFVDVCYPIMLPFNALTVGIAVMLVNRISGEKAFRFRQQREIVQDIQAGLMVVVSITFVLILTFVVIINNSIAFDDAQDEMSDVIEGKIDDIALSVEEGKPAYSAINHEMVNAHINDTGTMVFMDRCGNVVCGGENCMKETMDSLQDQEKEVLQNKEDSLFLMDIADISCFILYKQWDEYYAVGIYPAKEAYAERNTTIYLTAFLIIVVLAVLFIGTYILIRKTVVNNIRRINGKLSKIAAGDLDTVVDITSNEEFLSLSDDINSTVNTLKRYISEAENRINEELEFAKNIQSSALPKEYPASRRFELYASMDPAREIGGDFYDFYRQGDGICVFLVADVSGKGIPAALFMMQAKTLLMNLVDTGADVGTIFTKANAELCRGNDANMFVTAWMGIMDLDTRVVKFANAGHNYPVIVRKGGKAEFLKSPAGFVLAGMDGIKYKTNEITLNKGDRLFLYTDGVTEATNSQDELYGDQRLLESIDRAGEMSMRDLCKYIKKDVGKFAGDAPQFDDMTMLAVRLKDDDDMKTEKYVLPSEESMADVQEFIQQRMESLEVSMKDASRVAIIIDEIYSNIIKYSEASIAKIRCEIKEGDLLLEVKDNGIEYNPLEKEAPDTKLSAEERQIGGLGIFMVMKMAKNVEYHRQDGMNILTMIIEI